MRTATPTLEVSVISPYIGQERQGGTVMKRNKNQQRLTQTPKRKKKTAVCTFLGTGHCPGTPRGRSTG